MAIDDIDTTDPKRETFTERGGDGRRHETPATVEERLFVALDAERKGFVTKRTIVRRLAAAGITLDDGRLREFASALERFEDSDPLDFAEFRTIVDPCILLLERTFDETLVIPEFSAFCSHIDRFYQETLEARDGWVSTYIPQLARVDPEQYGVALCTVDGQRYATGDSKVDFCIQSCCKPINYCLALEEHTEAGVHRFIGREPSGRGFNELTLNHEGRPHNPMINSGAIMACALIKQSADMADRFDFVMDRWQALVGGQKIAFSNAVYLSERASADRNFALGYFMRENKAFPEETDLISTLEFYFQCCSIEMNAERMAIAAATLANGGICPTTGERVLSPKTVQHCLSLMASCGMYDFSGEFAFSIGLPAKSSVSGALMIVVPNVMGMCVWSPRIDRHGNSVRGVAFCRRLVETFSFHNYHSLTGLSDKIDPRRNLDRDEADVIGALIFAASRGDLVDMRQLVAGGAALDGADYDGRTPLHLAAVEGRLRIVRYLVESGVPLNPRDRWGNTPLGDALRGGHARVVEVLEELGAER